MEEALHAGLHARRLAAGWWLLALLALAVSTGCAVLLIFARMPLPTPWAAPAGLFREALVVHVNFAVVVWFLACAAGFWTLAGKSAGLLQKAALALAAAGTALMVLAPGFGRPQPILANYVPMLDSPLFLGGLAVLLVGVALGGTVALAGMRRLPAPLQAWQFGGLMSMLAAAVAFAALLAELAIWPQLGQFGKFETLAWGPGHLLQFVHVTLLMTGWAVLGEALLGSPVMPRRWLIGLLTLAILPALAAPWIYLTFPMESLGFRTAFTRLMSWGAWPAAALLAVVILVRLARQGRAVLRMETVPLALALALFLLGCFLGAAIHGESTMVPAHYHCTVGAVTLTYMAIGYRLLPAFGLRCEQGRLMRWQPAVYGTGLLLLASALAWSGWLGVPRKTVSADLALDSPAYMAAMGLAGLGGILAVLGAALYIFNMVRILGRRSMTARFSSGAALRYWVLAAVAVAGTFVIASFGQRVAVQPSPETLNRLHVRKEIGVEVKTRFEQGVVMLHAKRYEEALTAFHRVLELTPAMPEAHVNIGYALLGLKRYDLARDFFESATTLRKDQANAYYGLAEALEGMHDLPGAIGAMRTYLHLSPPNDQYRRKAESAIWEWEDALQHPHEAPADSSKPASSAEPKH